MTRATPARLRRRALAERSKNRLEQTRSQHYDEAGRLKLRRSTTSKAACSTKTRGIDQRYSCPAAGWVANWSAANADGRSRCGVQYTKPQRNTDALNRPTQVQYPADVNGQRAGLVRRTYNRAGALQQVTLRWRSLRATDCLLTRRPLTALFIAYGNGDSVLTR